MKNQPPPSGLTIGLELLIDDNWTPEQAWAVVELLDDLRERIWNHYQIPIQEYLREERGVIHAQQEDLSNWSDFDF
jgi:hypothetical protein